jgi:hypothetical protein
MVFTPEKRTITKYERETVKVTEQHIDSIMKWITPRDIEILMLLLKNNFMTTEQLEMTAFTSLKPSSWRNKANERLRRLYHAQCIDRFFPPCEKDAGSSQQICLLDYAGAKVIARYKGHVGKFNWRKKDYVPQNYRHSLKILDFKSLLYVLDRQIGFTDEGTIGEILRWETEHMKKFHFSKNNKIQQGKLIPDAFCIYKYTGTGKVKLFYLECDNATENMETLYNKMNNYRAYFMSGEWRQENWARALGIFPAILFVFHHQEQVDEMVAYSRRLNSNLKFLFTTYSNLYSDEHKLYVNSAGKKRNVLQERKVQILDSIWHSKDGLVNL